MYASTANLDVLYSSKTTFENVQESRPTAERIHGRVQHLALIPSFVGQPI